MNLSKIIKNPCYIRKFISRNILRFRTTVTRAIKHGKNFDESLSKKIEGIYYLKFNRNIIKSFVKQPSKNTLKTPCHLNDLFFIFFFLELKLTTNICISDQNY